MKSKALKSFEEQSKQLINLATKLSDIKDRKEGTTPSEIRRLRHELVVMLDSITKSLSRVFKL
ncbi:hypothetical protein LJB99_01395 [Deltaproteobacteria bacterium OttesenSCG-928-K17]|nr:hypothetical protein [Deltaproteobacteria bacterium OttesenSCG-928-K17]